jgi:outer membrane protein
MRAKPQSGGTRAQTIQALQTELQTKTQQLQDKFQQRKQEVLGPINALVQRTVDAIREEGGYSMILSNNPGATSILASDKNLDITDRVISRLRATRGPGIPPR